MDAWIIARSYERNSLFYSQSNGTDNHRKIIFKHWHIEFELVKNINIPFLREKKEKELSINRTYEYYIEYKRLSI